MWIQAVFVLLAAAPPSYCTQSGSERSTSTQGTSEDMQALLDRYADAVRVWTANQNSAGGRNPAPHPARAYWPRFQTLAETGDKAALGWLVDALAVGAADTAEAKQRGRWMLDRVFSSSAGEDAEQSFLSRLGRQADALGEDALLDLCQVVGEKSAFPEVRAQALAMSAQVRSEKGKTTDPMRRAEANELYNTILMEYPTTVAAQRAALVLFKDLNQSFIAGERKWLESVRAMQAQGRKPEEWPLQPFDEFRPLFVPLGRAKCEAALKWLSLLYPAFARAQRKGELVQGLYSIVDAFGATYPVTAADVTDLRLATLQILYTQFPDDPLLLESLRNLAPLIAELPVESTEQTLSIAIEKAGDPQARALALAVLADLVSEHGEVESDRRAIALLQRVLDEYPTTDAAHTAQKSFARLTHIQPGSPAPETVEADDTGRDMRLADFKGRVVMLDFYTLKDAACIKAAPSRGAVAKSMANRPFVLLGVQVGSAVKKRTDEHLAAYGCPLRSFIVTSPYHVIIKTWKIREYPTTVVIDADGIIRGRNLPWPETVELVERLVAQAESKPAPK